MTSPVWVTDDIFAGLTSVWTWDNLVAPQNQEDPNFLCLLLPSCCCTPKVDLYSGLMDVLQMGANSVPSMQYIPAQEFCGCLLFLGDGFLPFGCWQGGISPIEAAIFFASCADAASWVEFQ